MAYITQDDKKRMAPHITALCKKYGVKGSLSISNYSKITLTVQSGALDFISQNNATQVNEYSIDKNYEGKCREFLTEARSILNKGNHDNSDSMTDYFDVGWYVGIHIGKWDKPYQLVAK